MTLFKESFANDLIRADYKTFRRNQHKKHISHKKILTWNQTFRGLRRGLRAAYMQISSKQEKNHVNENLEKTPKHIMSTEINANYWV